MGGAASTQASFEQMLACTMILGDAMVQGLDPRFVRFPDLYRLYDFHVGPKNPRDQAHGFNKGGNMVLIVRSPDPDGKFQQLTLENGEAVKPAADKPVVLEEAPEENKLTVFVGNDKIVLDKATLHLPNNDGWTPLHSACHMLNAQEAGIAILKELVAGKADLNGVTRRGPGSFSCGWTALHVTCAYGLEALAIKLIRAGANVNTANSVGWTPLYDACHRGYTTIAQELLRAGAKHDVICPEFALCPFPGQLPLAAAARQGHGPTVKMLLEWGVNKNATNKLGWTALHEAAYHSRVAIVKMLVVYGADVLLKTDRGSIAKDLTIHSEIRTMLEDIASHLPTASSPSPPKQAEAAASTPNVEDKPVPAKKVSPLSRKEEYELLGDLPSLNAITIQDADAVDDGDDDAEEDTDAKAPAADSPPKEKHRKKPKDSSKKKKKKTGSRDIPPEFKCAVSLQLMKNPMRSPYGQVFERQVMEAWFRDFGNRCPLTGEPLTLQQLVSDEKLREEIREWKHGSKKAKAPEADAKETTETKEVLSIASPRGDEYDF
ncbi:Ankyrin repeat domain-containing protein 27 [Phytophthora pseudosyringae]|uniref:Ankyrin repeat domain-containing protein 27 n=1 Tax=Phytophthora pseudosyringae TaxID=221518 RepID=A0A8T1VP04_9STRA|nr:Ankyrin repeat domain-containing protein 27 [Phytophthora pseudosyringae]